MADGACDLGDVPHVRTWIITHLSPPVTIELCDEHFPPGLVGLLAADLGVEMPGLYTAIERFIGREAKKAAADLAAAQAAEQDLAAAGENSEATPDDDPGRPEVFDNDGVTVVVPDTGGGEL